MITKIALAAAVVATAGGATVYAVSQRSTSSTTTTASFTPAKAAAPSKPNEATHSIARRSPSAAAHEKLAAQIAAARKRRATLPSLSQSDMEGIKDYLVEAFGDIKPMINECLDHQPIGGKVQVRCNVTCEPDVGAVISSSEIIENGTTIHDQEVLDCVRETIASVELDPAQAPGDWSFETVVEMREKEED